MVDEQERAKVKLRRAAKRAATSAGKNWEALSPQERRALMQAAGGPAPKDPQRQAVRAQARQDAQKAGLNWKELPKEQRQSFLKAVQTKQP